MIAPPDALTFHGGRIRAAATHFAVPEDQWLDLSTGISPWSFPLPDVPLSLWQRLPEPDDLAALEAAATQAFGLRPTDAIMAVPGSDAAIRLLARLFKGQQATLVAPLYSGHQAGWPTARIWPYHPHEVPPASEVMILANPNNPDGRHLAPAKLHALAQSAQTQLIVDEAFADATPELNLIPDRRGTIILRSFGKFFGLAGARLGFVIADAQLIGRLRPLLGDWPLPGPVLHLGEAAYRNQEWQARQRQRLTEGSERLGALLTRHGLALVGKTAFFHLVSHPAAPDLFKILGRAGILVRPFADRSNWLRFGLPGDDSDYARLTTGLAQWRASL